MNNMLKAKILFILGIVIVMILVATTISTAATSQTTKNSDYVYLSDISYLPDKSFAQSGYSILLDKNKDSDFITLNVDGKAMPFLKGICAWATSEIVYDLSEYDYDYFTSYIGIDASEQSDYFNTGAKFYIYTSKAGVYWEEEYQSDILYGWSEATFIKINIKDANYLKLVADENQEYPGDFWSSWYDETVFADAKLIKEDYLEDKTEADFIKTVEEYDEKIKTYSVEDEITGEYELALLQRGLWAGGMTNNPNDPNNSNAITRYEIYKKLHQADKLDNEIFESLTIEEMRFVMNNIIDDEEIEWLNDYTNQNGSRNPYSYINYTFEYDYSISKYYDPANFEQWDKKYNLSKYNITYQTGYPKLWIVFEEGGVCGALSKTGSNIWGSYGVPSSVVGQPGHAAYIYYSLDGNGNGVWNLYNDIFGWQQSSRAEKLRIRMLNGWGNGSYASQYPVPYILLAQEIATTLKYYPLPMYDLLNLIETSIETTEYKVSLNVLLTKSLTEGTKATSNETIQETAVRAVANYLLGNTKSEIASFSFDGENAGAIVLGSQFDGVGVAWEYSLDNQDGNNGRIKDGQILVSMDGNSWDEIATITNWADTSEPKMVEFDEPVKSLYVKLVATPNYGDGRDFITAAMINLFEDITKEEVEIPEDTPEEIATPEEDEKSDKLEEEQTIDVLLEEALENSAKEEEIEDKPDEELTENQDQVSNENEPEITFSKTGIILITIFGVCILGAIFYIKIRKNKSI